MYAAEAVRRKPLGARSQEWAFRTGLAFMLALMLFAWKGHVWWHFVLAMATANVVGSLLGTRMALRHGAGFVRVVFLLVVSALICKTGYDAFLR